MQRFVGRPRSGGTYSRGVRSLVLFTRDLRIRDQPALALASRESTEVVPLFVLDPELLGSSPNRHRFLLESLVDLDRALEGLGGRLILRRGDVVRETLRVARESGCARVLLSGDTGAYAIRREARLAEACVADGVGLQILPGNSIVEPGAVAPVGRGAYRVFTPYHRAWLEVARPIPEPAPRRLRLPPDLDPGSRPDPAWVTPDALDPPRGGERAGRRRLHAFLGQELACYAEARDDLAANATSRLSPYLRFGCVSANELATRAATLPGSGPFLRQLAWRDFFRQLLANDPALAWRDLRAAVGVSEPPASPDRLVAAWREGRTGVPLVDAGMRQLQREGWMHNRARLVTASFLTRRLGIAWQRGERHFSRLLVDADPANDAGNWQWTAGTGADPRRTRTLAPVRQARRFDPTAAYVRRYVHELADVEGPRVFAPWLDPELLRRTGYPEPIVPVTA